MFRYTTNYRFYTLAKSGFGAAYLWYIFDFLRIHVAIWNQFSPLLSDASNIVFSGNLYLDSFLRRIAIFLSGKAMVWMFVLASPFVVGLYLWGRHKWLQFAVGCCMSFSMISLTLLVGFFASTADIWLNYIFVFYTLTALICPGDEWEKCELGFNSAKWRDNPISASTFAWFVVLLQFSVYFFAGINKLIDGWKPWTTGVALQNLAFDSSMREFVRGTSVPYWLSLILCYVTLLQRLVVPFGFFFSRYRIWSVLILGAMHIGYAILMYVNLFPLVGIASLVIILPPRSVALAQSSTQQQRRIKEIARRKQTALVQNTFLQRTMVCLLSLCLILESTRLTMFRGMPWENKLMIVPAWRMFADGGRWAGGKWRLILSTPEGDIDGTDIALRALPHSWRDRFYIDTIFHDLLSKNTGPGSLVDKLLQATEEAYRDRQLQLKDNPVILGADFDIIYRNPNIQSH
jgi:hypothetical protein